MAIYVECDEDGDEESPSFFLLSPFSNRFSLLSLSRSLFFSYICVLASATSMHIIISCFVRREEKNDRVRERKRIVLFLANQEYALSRFFLVREQNRERKTQLIGEHIHIDRFESLPDTFAKGQVEREQGEKKTRERENEEKNK